LTLARATSARVCGTSVVLGPWYSVCVLIQHSVIMFRATSMADTDIDAINNTKHVQFLSSDRSTGSCICPCRQNITDTHKRRIHDPVLLSQVLSRYLLNGTIFEESYLKLYFRKCLCLHYLVDKVLCWIHRQAYSQTMVISFKPSHL